MPYEYDPARLTDEVTLAPTGSRTEQSSGRNLKKDMEAARLKALGWDVLDIAEALNIHTPDDPVRSQQRVMAAVKRAMAAAVRFSKDEYRYLDLAGLEEMERRCWQMLADKHVLVNNGRIIYGGDGPLDDSRLKLEIMQMISSIKRDKAKLMGYNAPTRTQIEISDDMLNAAIQELSEQVAEQEAIEAATGES